MTLIFICSLITFAADETGIIRGKVTTSDGNPAEAVTVTFKGTKRSAVTDEYGNFVVRNLEPGNYGKRKRNHQYHHRTAGIFQRPAGSNCERQQDDAHQQ